MKLTPETLAALNAALTPEAACRIFVHAVSDGLGQSFADAMATALGADGSGVPSWADHIGTVLMELDFGTIGSCRVSHTSVASSVLPNNTGRTITVVMRVSS